MTNYIYSWNANSKGAKQLSRSLGIQRIRHEGSRFRGGQNKTVINWGSTQLPVEILKCHVFNQPHAIEEACDKGYFFDTVSNNLTPEYTNNIRIAQEWIKEGYKVVCRTLLRASAGRGIVVARTVDELVPAPLYVKYRSSSSEWRVHIWRGEVFDTQRKVRAPGTENPNWEIRTHANGFIYQRNGLVVPPSVPTVAKAAFIEFELDFGAVDILYSERQDRAWALEINSAPGLEGQTLQNYVNILQENLL